MKKIVILFTASILLSVSAPAQNDATSYKVKLEKYKSWKRSGLVITITGAAIAAVGAGLLISSKDDFFDGPGGPLILIGGATMIPGVIFRSIGKSKSREYQIRLDGLKTGFYYNPSHSGIMIRYRF